MKYWVYPNVTKAGGLQSQGVEGEAVVIYCEPLPTPDLMSSGLSRRVNNMAKSTPSFLSRRSSKSEDGPVRRSLDEDGPVRRSLDEDG